jgi:hypothetical protein
MLALSAWRCMGARPPGSSLLAAHAGVRHPTAGLRWPMLAGAPDSSGGGGARVVQPLLRPVLAAAMQGGHAEGGGGPGGRKSSSYTGVSWSKGSSAWRVDLRGEYIGLYASEEDAARAYDCAAVELLGLGTKRNFPDEVISEMPASLGDERRESKTSRFSFGVSWDKASKSWRVDLWDPEAKRQVRIGLYASEEDAARAYDCAAVELHGPGYTKRNFPDEVISQPPASLGDALTSRYRGVNWVSRDSVWRLQLYIPKSKRLGDLQAKSQLTIGLYDSEVDVAMAYDCAAVQLHGPDWPKRNFPGEVITKAPESRGDEQRRLKASR